MKMFSLYIYWSNCDPESESLHHRKCSAISGKITIYKSLNKALLALRYSLLVRNLAAEIIGNTLFSTSVCANTIHYTHRFFITRIYAYMYINNTYLQYWRIWLSCQTWLGVIQIMHILICEEYDFMIHKTPASITISPRAVTYMFETCDEWDPIFPSCEE